jgi:hypothetical protein
MVAVLLAGGAALLALALYATSAFGSGETPDQVILGDIDCDGLVDARDAVGAIRHHAGLSVDQHQPCFQPGSVAAIPGPPGIMHFAHVTYFGELEAGTATAASHSSTGTYHVTFPIPLTGCVAVATPGPLAGGAYNSDAHAVILMPASSDTLTVDFYTPDGTPADTDFHLILAC